MTFNNAQEAFETIFDNILINGIEKSGTKAIFNYGFTILNPLDNEINTSYRKWNKKYADIEWEWYLSKNRSVEELKKIAKIWDSMHNGDNIVNSNYGYQWDRNDQLNKVIEILKNDNNTRKALITIYDGKEINDYRYDTPCTIGIRFWILKNKLNMDVMMRSNDLVYGFCNDQYCFSKLMEIVANKLNISIGKYHHFVNDLHIYQKHYNLKNKC